MGDSTCHLTQRAQSLLLNHDLLSLAQVVIRMLQGRVDLALVCRQRHMFAQLPEKFAVTAAEGLGLMARRNEKA